MKIFFREEMVRNHL